MGVFILDRTSKVMRGGVDVALTSGLLAVASTGLFDFFLFAEVSGP